MHVNHANRSTDAVAVLPECHNMITVWQQQLQCTVAMPQLQSACSCYISVVYV
jgi:hypothetical protein